ncbi:MAG: beta-ketoacyl-[acyl-carrier-protein] synthase II, partial [Alistipes sp.]|nr:beta-ketoacyl-[acyl-carrier-protein] synthase II [Alistipes sp.]
MENRVVITGLGVVSPVGNNVTDFWNSLVEGKCGIDLIKGFEEYELPVSVAGQVKDFNPEADGLERNDIRRNDKFCTFAMAAAAQAMTDSGLKSGENIEPERLGVYIGSGIGGMDTFVNETEKLLNEGVRRISPLFVPMMISNIASGNVAIKHNAQGVCLPVVTACATGTTAVGEAFRAIKHGYADAIIAGGTDHCTIPIGIAGVANARALSRSE